MSKQDKGLSGKYKGMGGKGQGRFGTDTKLLLITINITWTKKKNVLSIQLKGGDYPFTYDNCEKFNQMKGTSNLLRRKTFKKDKMALLTAQTIVAVQVMCLLSLNNTLLICGFSKYTNETLIM